VTFAKKIEQQSQCAARKTTNRVLRIDGNGNLIYDSVCTKWVNVTVNAARDPVEVHTKFLGGLQKGASPVIMGGAVILSYPKDGAKLPSIIFGTAIK